MTITHGSDYNRTMGYLNLSSSIRYGPHGKKRKTKAFTSPKKTTKYKKLIAEQQKIYDQVMQEVDKIPSLVTGTVGNLTPKTEPMQYTGERKLLGIATMHKSNLVPVFEEEIGEKGQYAKDLARMRR